MIDWINSHLIEIFGAITGVIYVLLEIRQKIWLWPLGIITSTVYIWVFLTSKFYADMGLQVYYLLISIYGWLWWLRGGPKIGSNNLRVTNITRSHGISLTGIFFILFAGIWFILKRYTDSPLPGWDSFTTALSIIATWMLARKIIEHWILWIIADLVSMILYIYKGLYPTVILFGVYTVMAVIGLRKWRRDAILQTE